MTGLVAGLALIGVLVLGLTVWGLALALQGETRAHQLTTVDLVGELDRARDLAADLEAQLALVAAQHGPVSETDDRCLCGWGVDCPTWLALTSDPPDPGLAGRVLDELRSAER